MNADVQKIPEHEAIYSRIRDAILFGELVPGQAVTLQGLADLIGAGMMPVREAVRRLTAQGALERLGNRRIVVPTMRRPVLDQIEFARLQVEPELARLAAERSELPWIETLSALDAQLNDAIVSGSVELYLRFNYQFHMVLYAQAGAEILQAMAQDLWLRSGPSLRVVCGQFGTANLPDFHDEALAALRAGDTAATVRAIRTDIQQGIGQIRQAISEDRL